MRPLLYCRTNKCAPIQRGFVALVSALIVSLVLMLLVLSEGTATFWTRADQTDQEQSTASRALAESCMYEALLDYAEDSSSLATRISMPSGTNTCTIEPEHSDESVLTLTTHATVGSIPAFIIVTATDDSGSLSVTSWRTATSIPP